MRLQSWGLFVVAVVWASAIGWSQSPVIGQDPKPADSVAAFETWNLEGEPVQLLAQAKQQYAEATKAVSALVKQVESGNFKTVNLSSVGEAHVKVRELFRSARGLTQWGEPAGIDFQHRADELHAKSKRVMQTVRDARNPEVRNLYQQLVNKAAGGSKRVLPIAGGLYQKEKYLESEAAINKLYDDLEVLGVWFDTLNERESPFGEMDRALAACGTKIEESRTANRKAAATAILAKRQPKYAQVLQRIEDAAASVAASGQVELGGQKISGPQAFAKYVGGLQQVRLAGLSCVAISALEGTPEAETAGTKALAELAEFQSSVLPAVAKVVAADTQRATEADALNLYGEYIVAIAPLSALYDDATVKNTFTSPLDMLKTKSQALAADSGAYQAATSDYLRWRARAAQAAAKQAESKFPKFNFANLARVELDIPSPTMVEQSHGTEIAGQGTCQNFRGGPAGDIASTGHVNFIDTRVPVAPQAAEAYAALKTELLVSDPMPPLSLDAALALESTRRGDLVAAGGKVSDVEVQAALPLFSRLTLSDWGVAAEPLAENPFTVRGVPAIKQIRLRMDLEPEWLQLRYAFVNVPGK